MDGAHKHGWVVVKDTHGSVSGMVVDIYDCYSF